MLFEKILIALVATLIFYIFAYISIHSLNKKFCCFLSHNAAHSIQRKFSLQTSQSQSRHSDETHIAMSDIPLSPSSPLSPLKPLSPLSPIRNENSPSPPPTSSTPTQHHFESQTDNAVQQESQSPKRRKISHPGGDEKEEQDNPLDTTSNSDDSGDTVLGDDNHDNPLEHALVSEEPGDTTMDDWFVEFLHSSPQKLTRRMSFESTLEFNGGPRTRLWESLKQAIIERHKFWICGSVYDDAHRRAQAASSYGIWSSYGHYQRTMVTDAADMVLDCVPYFEREVVIQGKSRYDALYTTEICIDQERGLKVTLRQLLLLVPSSNDSWLEEDIMSVLVHLKAPVRYLEEKGCLSWFYQHPTIQMWCAAINPEVHTTEDQIEKVILQLKPAFGLLARDIPAHVNSMVFFSNRTESHWKAVIAWVNEETNKGNIYILNSWGDTFQWGSAKDGHRGRDFDCLPRLMMCIAHESPNPLFRDADWLGGLIDNINCRQQYGTDDCGAFSVNAVFEWLMKGKVIKGWHTGDEERVAQGQWLRRDFIRRLKRYLDMHSIAKETSAELARNGRRRWSVSGQRTGSGKGV